MSTVRPLSLCIAGVLMLQACATQQPARQAPLHPALQVRHSTSETAEAYYQLGRQHQQQGNLDVALTGYTYAIARDPRHLEARSAAAAIHAQQGRLDQARAMMLAVIADYPQLSQAHNNLGYIDYLRGDHAAAVRETTRALVLDPANSRARNNLRLAEAAVAASRRDPALPEQAAPPVLAAAPVPVPVPPMRAGQLELVQLVPNVYELKMMAKVTAPMLAAAPAPVAAKAVQPAPAASRIEVANADGTPGLARRVGSFLGQNGYAVARLTNERPYGQRATRIQYRAGYAAQAEALGQLVDGRAQLVESLPGGADVRVVLGRDTQRAMALQGGAGAVRLATR